MLAAYSALALPLAAAALPVYVHAPKFYAELGLSLALIGALLLAVRTLDALSDPLLGMLADRVPARLGGRRLVISAAAPLLAGGMVMTFHPPADSGLIAVWLVVSFMLVYLGLSAVSISYLAIGSSLSADYHQRTRITAARGVVSLAGVLFAAVAPELLAREAGTQDGLAWFSLIFVPVLAVAAAITLLGTPAPAAVTAGATRATTAPGLGAMFAPLANRSFRALALVFLLNGVAAAIPATLILFFVADVLQRPDFAAAFLAIYFLSGAAGMPVWVVLARRIGKARAWLVAMGASVVAFVWAYGLGPGDVLAFAVVCAVSGVVFGADLALPASLLADVIDRDARKQIARPDGAYFGLWHLIEKLALALAAGLALPLLDGLGYRPGIGGASTALSAVYALLPCAIKLAAAGLLFGVALEPTQPANAGSLEGEAT